jgi:2-dehydropantoate 2-reductase
VGKSYSDKKILIAGAGAVGSFYGGLMAHAGYDVTLLARGKHLQAMQESGELKYNSVKHGKLSVNINATDKTEEIFDIIFLCAKSHDTAKTCADLKNNLKADGCIVSFQNGVENPEIIAQIFGDSRTVAASLYIGSAIEPAGTVYHTALGNCIFGSWSEDPEKFIPMLQEIFDNSKIEAVSSENIREVLWNKLIWNIAYNPLSALTGSTCGPMIKSEVLYPLMEGMVLEVVKAAETKGVIISEEKWKKTIAHKDSLERYKTSMLQDVEKLRSPELDGILGAVIRALESVGEKAPYCEAVYRTLQFMYGKRFIYCPRLTTDMIVRKDDSILLIERKNEPHGWALPGGFVDYGETVEHGAVRELSEETGIEAGEINLLGVYSDPERDARGHTVSVVYYTDTEQSPVAGDDAKNAVFFKIEDLPDNIVFDHKKIINDYLIKT